MSRTIDERVVSMQFDNKQFESNVRTSLGTLEKLKQSLNFKSASKGFENLNAAAKGCNLNPLGSAVETVKYKFSALEVMAVTALANITNSAVNAGKRIIKSLTIDPIRTGLSEYETQINAIQTIMANTQSKGTTMDDVNRALDELNTYADKTIYNFTEMTRNIGTFTAAGVDLEKSVTSIKGIANLAAVSGSTSQQASTAMYQLSQALATGTVKLMDWNSVVNAGMGGEVFQNALKRTATQMGHNVDALIKKYGSFRESLTQGNWLTAEVLTETLTQLSGAYTKADLISQGYSEKQAQEIVDLAKTAESAATDVKTFTQLMDTLKESAQSGWTQTWELIVGDFEEAKGLWSNVSEEIGGFINSMSESRNNLLDGALTSNWDKMIQKVNEAGIETTKFEEKLKESIKSHGMDVEKLIKDHGSLEEAFKSGAVSSDILKEAVKGLEGSLLDLSKVERGLKKGSTGEDVKKVQKALKDLGYDLGKFGDGSGIDGIIGSVTEKAIKDFQKAQGLKVTGIIDDETIAALEKANGNVEGLYDSVKDLIGEVDKLGGRELLIKSFANIWKGIKSVITPIKDAFRSIFPPVTSEQLYKLIEGFHKLTEKFKLNTKQSAKLKRTFQGLFAIVDIFWEVAKAVGGSIAKLIPDFSGLGDKVLALTSRAANAILKFRTWLLENGRITDGISKLGTILTTVAGKIRDWITAFIELPEVQKALGKIKTAFTDTFGSSFDKVKEFINLFKNLGKTVENEDGSFKLVSFKDLIDFFKNDLVGSFKKINFGDLFTKIKNSLISFRDAAKSYLEQAGVKFDEIGEKISNFVKMVKEKLGDNMGTILAIGVLVGFLFLVKKIKDGVELFAKPFDAVGDFLGDLGKTLKSFGQAAKAVAIKNIATSIAILAGSVAVLAMLDQGKVWSAVGAITVLAGELLLLSILLGNDKFKPGDFGKLSVALLGLAGSMLIMAIAARMIGGMDGRALIKGGIAIAAFMGMVILLSKSTKDISAWVGDFGKMMLKLSVALLLFALVIKIIGSMDTATLIQGGAAVVIFLGTMVGMMAATKLLGKDATTFGKAMVSLSAALLLMAVAIKILGNMDPTEMIQGGAAVVIFLGTMVGMMAATKLLAKDIPKFGTMMLGLGASLLLMAAAVAILGNMDPKTIIQGGIAVAAFLGAMVGMMAAMKLITKNAKNAAKVGLMMLGFSTAILMLAGSVMLLGMLDTKTLFKGVAAVAVIGIILAGLVVVTKYAKSIKAGTIIALSVAVGILAVAVAALSFVEGSKLAGATIALGVLIGMFALLVAATSKIKSGMATLIILTIAVGVMGGVLYMIASLPIQNTLVAAASLSVLLLAIAGACAILGTIPATVALKGALVLIVLAAVLALVVWGFSKLAVSLTGDLIDIADNLSEFMNRLQPFLDGAKKIDPSSLEGIKTLANVILTLTGARLLDAITSFITGGSSLADFANQLVPFGEAIVEFSNAIAPMSESATEKMNKVASIVEALVEISNKLPKTGGLAQAITGTKDLSDFATGLTDLGGAIASFNSSVADMTDADATKIGNIGTAIEKFVEIAGKVPETGGLKQKITGIPDLVTFATNLVTLGEAIATFNSSVVEMTDEDVTKIGKIGGVIDKFVEIAGKVPETGGLKQAITGVPDLATFANGLGILGTAIVSFNAATASLTEEDTNKISTIGTVIDKFVEIANKVPETGGLKQAITGVPDLATFATNLVTLGAAIVTFNTSVTDITTEDTTKLTNIGNTIDKFVEIAGKVPETGGLSQAISGTPDLATFATNLVTLGNAIVLFNTSVGDMTEADAGKLSSIGTAIDKFVEIAGKVPETGGMAQAISGTPDLVSFAGGLSGLGTAIASFNTSVAEVTADDATKLGDIGTVIDKFVEISKKIPASDGLKQAIEGTPSLATFAGELQTFGEAICDFAGAVSEVSGDEVDKITSIGEAAKTLVNVASSLKDYDDSEWFNTNLTEFAGELKTFGTKMAEYAGEIEDIDTTKFTGVANAARTIMGVCKDLGDDNGSTLKTFGSNAKTFGEKIAEFADEIADVDTDNISTVLTEISKLGSIDLSGLTTLSESLGNIGKSSVDAFVSAFTGSSGQVLAAGALMMTSLMKGVSSGTGRVLSLCSMIGVQASGAVRSSYTSFYSAGGYVAQGFANGISAKSFLAIARAKAMAQKAYQAAKQALNINSPSKLFRSLGYSVPEGFALGIDRLSGMVKDSAVGMADTAINGTKNAISRIAEAINTDVDAQPTIRPVLDLSEVSAGAGAINGMLGMKPSVGVLANVNAISSAMSRGQNGANGDVVSAIEKLGKNMGKTTGDTYNINGVTYDDGSNITDAVKTLVRAARVERRS